MFSIVCAFLSFAVLAYHHYSHRLDPPNHLPVAVKLVNMGYIPHELSGHIPVDYELREEYSMSATLERTFVQRGRPMWIIRLVLDDGHVVSDQAVLFDSNGDLYQ